MSGLLSLLFWSEASDGFGWADAALAIASALLFVFGTILARRREKATWIKQPPTWRAHSMLFLGAFTLMFGAIYGDAYLLHRNDLTARRFRDDVILAVFVTAGTVWSWRRSWRRRSHERGQVL